MKPTESTTAVWTPTTLYSQEYASGILSASRHNLQPYIDNLAVDYTKVMQINHLADVSRTAEAYWAANKSRNALIERLRVYTTKDDSQQWASTMADGIIEDICKRISNDMESLGHNAPAVGQYIS